MDQPQPTSDRPFYMKPGRLTNVSMIPAIAAAIIGMGVTIHTQTNYPAKPTTAAYRAYATAQGFAQQLDAIAVASTSLRKLAPDNDKIHDVINRNSLEAAIVQTKSDLTRLAYDPSVLEYNDRVHRYRTSTMRIVPLSLGIVVAGGVASLLLSSALVDRRKRYRKSHPDMDL
ncbi:TPA: hypothetical protein HA251_03500 [Candidatus Woesearchaeota archaeon]|nr:hypothetical protein [Candidatus Woesearchaeota archaeon]